MPKRQDGAARREHLIATTADVLLKKGLTASTTRDVTGLAGIGVGLLNHYFSWSDLRAAALDRLLMADIDARLPEAAPSDPLACLREFTQQSFSETLDPIWRLWIEGFDQAGSDQLIAAVLRRNAEQAHARLARLFQAGHAAGVWRCNDAFASALRVTAMQDGLIGLILAGGDLLSRAEAARHLWIAARHECETTGPLTLP